VRFIDIRFTWVTTCTLHNWDHPYMLRELENVLSFWLQILVYLLLDQFWIKFKDFGFIRNDGFRILLWNWRNTTADWLKTIFGTRGLPFPWEKYLYNSYISSHNTSRSRFNPKNIANHTSFTFVQKLHHKTQRRVQHNNGIRRPFMLNNVNPLLIG